MRVIPLRPARPDVDAGPVPIEYARLVRSRATREERAEVRVVDEMVRHLRARLHEKSADIDRAHVFGASSADVQVIVSTILCKELRFREEVVLKATGFDTRARPDFIRRISRGRGVIAEVERGGTVNGNFDLKDFWKTHIAPDAQHLVLVVPRANWNAANSVREQPYLRVCQRLQSFFGDPRREVDVLSCHVLGYGRARFRAVAAASGAAQSGRSGAMAMNRKAAK
jgi:hypothetical protein